MAYAKRSNKPQESEQSEQKRVGGALWLNDKGCSTADQRPPVLRGHLTTPDGTYYYLSGWLNLTEIDELNDDIIGILEDLADQLERLPILKLTIQSKAEVDAKLAKTNGSAKPKAKARKADDDF